MLYLAGIIITVFLAIILLSRKGKAVADKVLAVWLCVIGFHLALYYWQITGEIYDHPYLLGIIIPIPLLHGPLLFIYTVTVTRYDGFSKRNWLHFIPAVIAYFILADFFKLTPAERINVYKHRGAGFETQSAIILIATIISGFTYVWLSFYELKKYGRTTQEQLSNTEKINLNWLRYLIYGILGIWVVIFFNGDDSLIFGTAVLFVFLLGFFGIRHTDIFTYRRVILKEDPVTTRGLQTTGGNAKEMEGSEVINTNTVLLPAVNDTEANGQNLTTAKYERSGLQKDVADKIHRELSLAMMQKKVFKNEELSLAELAKELDVHPNNLSQVINAYENKNFYDYVNTWRIEEFKTLVLSPANNNYTLLSLAFECGFNSKTSFNRNFKKITGQSPSAYLKDLNVMLTTA